MKRVALSILFVFGLAISAFGQESLAEELELSSFKRSFSLELGSGFAPIHTLADTRSLDVKYAPLGQAIDDNYPLSFTLSGVWRFDRRWEAKLTIDTAWFNCELIQYPEFGTDPSGKPRYRINYNQAEHLGRINDGFRWSATAILRHIWNPQKAFQTYSEFGLGYVFGLGSPALIPGITFIGLRYCWGHFYLYAENTFSPAATLIHGGLGWKF
ncbi:MAG: hypothetical protein K5909_05480 [Bacteroidales bacterium]|nr:hypothetical protein [Bacteroidales bacterium]